MWIEVVVFVALWWFFWGVSSQRPQKPQEPQKPEAVPRGVAPAVLAALTNATYADQIRQQLPYGWRNHSRPIHNVGGIDSCCIDIFINELTNAVVVAVRGTHPGFLGDLVSDVKLLRQKFVNWGTCLPEYTAYVVQQMEYVQRRFPDHEKYLAGHSLGACTAEAAWLTTYHRQIREPALHESRLALHHIRKPRIRCSRRCSRFRSAVPARD